MTVCCPLIIADPAFHVLSLSQLWLVCFQQTRYLVWKMCKQYESTLGIQQVCGKCSNVYINISYYQQHWLALLCYFWILPSLSAQSMDCQHCQTDWICSSPGGPIPLLSHFISWINLDLGLDFLSWYGKLSYLGIIMIIIAVSAHCSIFVSKFVGYNCNTLLATLILLAYTTVSYGHSWHTGTQRQK